tara:strand:+ start:306 stop:839 length:534 start_codon:yes stop_codon:yes gene_type:complete
MAHFAELDETNTVIRMAVVHNDVTTVDGVEDEERGIDFLNDLHPESGTWVQTSYNRNFRSHYAGVGMTYDAERDAFIRPQPFPSWTLDSDNQWVAPSPHIDGRMWDEDTLAWVQPPSPYPSWVWAEGLSGHGMAWMPPVPYPIQPPDDPSGPPYYEWDEDTTSYAEVAEPPPSPTDA